MRCKNGRNAQCEAQGMHEHKGRVLNGLEECRRLGGGVCVVVNIISRSDSCRYFSWKHLSFARINCPTAPRCVLSPPSPIRISRSPYPQPSERLFDYLQIDAACSKEKPKEKPHHRLISISAAKNSPLSSFQSASSGTLRSHTLPLIIYLVFVILFLSDPVLLFYGL
jgi:hypothetical protein